MEGWRIKNDGTDLKKDDGSGKNLEATDRTCFMTIVNKSGVTITDVTLTHTSGDTNTILTAAELQNNGESVKKQIGYETGWWADFDYWNISFKIGNQVYDTPNNDRCNIAYEDAGKTIQCEILNETTWGGDYTLYVNTPKSSGCKFKIVKN
jgi:hypothetical protein